MKLQGALKGLLYEIASMDTIIDAVKNKKICIIYYDGDEPGGRGLRVIEPVCFGYSKADNPVLRAWDEEGSSHTAYRGEQPLPGWRLFRVDKILSFNPTAENMGQYLIDVIGPRQLEGTGVKLVSVNIEETRKCNVTVGI